MKISKAALAAILAGGASMTVLAASADAQVLDSLRNRQRSGQQQQQQEQQAAPTAQPGERQYNVSREERAALQPLLTAVAASDWPTARAAIPAAQAAARGADAKYIIGQAMLRIGIGANDRAMQVQAIDALIASGGALPDEMRGLYENQLNFAVQDRNTAKAQQAQAALDALNPNDPARFIRQGALRAQANDYAGALPLYLQGIQAMQAAGQPISADLRRAVASLAYQSHSPDTVRYMREWLTAAPATPAAWHDTLAIYAEQGTNSGMKLDIFRLMRGAGAMTSERDYVTYAEAANESRAYAEVAAVLQDGLNRNAITQNATYARETLAQANQRATAFRPIMAQERQSALSGRDAAHATYVADAYFGAGQYAEAAELYRAAMTQGADANTSNIRIGAALALAGRRAEAETALRAVTGPRAELAQLWLLWLSTRAS